MRRPLLLTGMLLASSLAFGADSAPRAAPEFGKIWATWAKALNAKDAAAAAAVYATNGELYPPGEAVVKGRAAIETYWKGAIDAGVTASITSVDSAVSGGLGYETGSYVLTIKGADGKTTTQPGKYVSIFVKEGGAWKVRYDCWNASPAPKAPEAAK